MGFWAGCGWLIPGSCQAPTGPLHPQHRSQGIEGTRARKLQDKVGLRDEGKRKIQVKQRTWLSPSFIQLPSQPPNNLHLGCQTLFLLPKNPSFYCNSQNTGALPTVSATNPKHSIIQAATKKVNTIPVRPSTLTCCSIKKQPIKLKKLNNPVLQPSCGVLIASQLLMCYIIGKVYIYTSWNKLLENSITGSWTPSVTRV